MVNLCLELTYDIRLFKTNTYSLTQSVQSTMHSGIEAKHSSSSSNADPKGCLKAICCIHRKMDIQKGKRILKVSKVVIIVKGYLTHLLLLV